MKRKQLRLVWTVVDAYHEFGSIRSKSRKQEEEQEKDGVRCSSKASHTADPWTSLPLSRGNDYGAHISLSLPFGLLLVSFLWSGFIAHVYSIHALLELVFVSPGSHGERIATSIDGLFVSPTFIAIESSVMVHQ